MRSLWQDAEARQFVDRYAPQHGEDLALRVYTSRLIGRDDTLVLHGGGNTSVKTKVKDILGDDLDVLCVKGSGWDLVSIEPQGLPAVELAPLLRLRRVARMTDEEMVAQVRRRLLDPGAPNPSVETFLHAFVPRKFVDHTHADAIMVLTNQPDGEQMVRDALGERVLSLPWIFPGFPLAHAVADAFERAPDCEGIVLQKHGIFTFGDNARDSYERMIELVDRAERFVASRGRGRRTMLMPTSTLLSDDEARALVADVAPVVRGAVALASSPPHGPKKVHTRFVMCWRGDDDLRAFAAHPEAARLVGLGPLTPDHVIRTKGRYLWLSLDDARSPAKVAQAVLDYEAQYHRYFAEHRHRVSAKTPMADPMPRVVIVEGLGILAFGVNAKAAGVAADIAEHTLRAKAQAESIGSYTELDPGEVFAMEYWSLEVAKLGKAKAPVLGGQVAFVTGAAGAIGFGIARALLEAGAEVMVSDFNEDSLARIHNKLLDRFGSRVAAVPMDVTDDGQVAAAFADCCRRFGGVDIVVPNAGVAYVSKIADMDLDEFRRVVDVNLIGAMNVVRTAAQVLAKQGTGGAIVVQGSKNVFDPGAGFGAYSASKAGAHQIGKIAALELAEIGVTVNMINADAVFGDDDVPSGLWQEVGPDRMRARGLDAAGLREYYRNRSLLKREVTPEHVGAAVVFFASGATPTTGATLPVDAGVPGAFPR
ncbi:MAG: bifunctional aldolase/short-chain dehydrogenase [Planctomycetota bacterium]